MGTIRLKARLTGAAMLGLFLALGTGAPVAAQGGAVTLRGAGATFPAPLYHKWLEAYGRENPNLRITYDSVGSGDGISRFIAGTVDFGASDAALSDKDAAKVARGAVLVPATSGMIALAYNLPGLAQPLRLPRDVYVDILLGKIHNWGDPRIRQANPGASIQSRTIAVVARLDKSGTTHALTNHLSAISQTWRDGHGVANWIEWPRTAMLARGNEGVAARIRISEGSIGYVEYGFAKRLGLTMAELENKAGKYVAPDEAGAKSALSEVTAGGGSDFKLTVPDPATPTAYPIATFSWLMLYQRYEEAPKRAALTAFVDWSLTKGQELGPALGYVPLPDSVVARGRATLGTIR